MSRNQCSAALALLILMFTSRADASAIVSITGTGSIELGASGSIYFDASGLHLSRLSLEASDSISLGNPLPSGVVDSSFETLVFEDVELVSGLFIEGDLYFDVFEFTGSLTLRGENIFASGQFGTFGADIDSQGCDSGDAMATVISSGVVATLLCDDPLVDGIEWTDSSLLVPGGGELTPAGVVPEPSGALLFGIGWLIASRCATRSSYARPL